MDPPFRATPTGARAGLRLPLAVALGFLVALSGLAHPETEASPTAGSALATPASGPTGSVLPTTSALPAPNWRNLSTGPSGAGPLSAGTLAYDPLDGYVLWVGGSAANGTIAQTWSFSGGAWSNLTPSLGLSPPASPGPASAFDADAGSVVLVLGAAGDGNESTWLFAGGSWTNDTSASPISPPGRQDAALAYDPGCLCVVLFGGLGRGAWLNDTWSWTAGVWTAASPGPAPAPRAAAGLTFDATDGSLLLVGGTDGGGPLNDTWSLSAGNWTAVPGASAPGSIAVAADAISAAPGGRIVGFGGTGCGASTLGLCNRTYAYSDGRWTEIPSAAAPSPREGMEMVYDAADGYVLAVGGTFPDGPGNESWALGGPVTASLVLDPPDPQAPNASVIRTYASGGYGNYTYSYWFPDSEEGTDCPSVDLPVYICHLDLDDMGTRTVIVNVTDQVGNRTSATSAFHLNDPLLVEIYASVTYVDVGQTFTVIANATQTYPVVSYGWAGLPDDCAATSTARIDCTTALVGFYAISCTIRNSFGTQEATNTVGIWVDPAPIVGGWPSRTSGPAPLAVAFNSTAFSGTPPYSLLWHFGDGGTSASPSPTHTYETPGTYTVTLSATDATGLVTNWTGPEPIVVGNPLNVSISGPGVTGSAPTTATLVGVVSGGTSPYSYEWQLPNGSTSDRANVTIPVAAAGTYTVPLTVIDATGTSAHATVTFTIAGPSGGSSGSGPATSWGWIVGLPVIALIVGVAGGWWAGRRRPPAAEPPASDGPPAGPPPSAP